MNKLILTASFVIGAVLSWGLTSSHYKDILLEEAEAYKESVQAVRNQEQYWRTKASEAEDQYYRDLETIRTNNSVELDRLRKQLSEAGRVSSECSSPSISNGSNGRSELAKRIEELAEFSNRCSKRADELIIQVRALQSWIKENN